MKNKHFNIKYTEAKDFARDLYEAIKETRRHIYVLISIMFGLLGFFSGDFFNLLPLSFKSTLFYITIPFAGILLWFGRSALLPYNLQMFGIEPKNLEDCTDTTNLRESVIHTYQDGIDHNMILLKRLSRGYRKAFATLLCWLLALIGYSTGFFLI